MAMKTFTDVLAKTAARIEKTVQSTVHETMGPKCLQDYEQGDQIGSGGPGLLWKLFKGKPRSKSALALTNEVCIWVLDKKAISDERQRKGTSKVAEDALFDIFRQDAAQLQRLRHPGVVRVIDALDENKSAMAFVTEPLFASVANVMKDFTNISKIPTELQDLEISQLEVKHGLLQVAETLGFLHNNARLIHRSISPESVFITAGGAWKFGGFGFAVYLDQLPAVPDTDPAFHYPDYDAPNPSVPLVPQLDYVAPELTRSHAGELRTSADLFSLANLAYRLVANKPLLSCNNNLKTYTSSVNYLQGNDFTNLPLELVPELRRMLSQDALSRPSAIDFGSSAFFREDQRLRALRFLDHMLERDNLQKTEFLKALGSMWTGFDTRVLRFKVLPPLCAELRNESTQQFVLPMILSIADAQDVKDFNTATLPLLMPVMAAAQGDTLLLLVRHTPMLLTKVGTDVLKSHLLPLLVRSYDDPDVRIQEEVLRRTKAVSEKLDFKVLRQALLPRIHGLALKTAVAAVRVHALICLGDMVQRLDKTGIMELLTTMSRVVAVDHSAPTLMCVLGCCDVIYKQNGLEFAAEHILPLLTPLLIAQQLNQQQFAKYMKLIYDVLKKIEEKRGVNATDPDSVSSAEKVDPFAAALGGAAISRVGSSPSLPNGNTKTGAGPKPTSGLAWDADEWNPTSSAVTQSKSTNELPSLAAMPSVTPASTGMPSFEWPPPSLSANPPSPAPPNPWGSSVPPAVVTPPLSGSTPIGGMRGTSSVTSPQWSTTSSPEPVLPRTSMGGGGGSSYSVDDEDDPFASWPPRPTTGGAQGSSVGISGGMAGLGLGSPSLGGGMSTGAMAASNLDTWSLGGGTAAAAAGSNNGGLGNGTGMSMRLTPPPKAQSAAANTASDISDFFAAHAAATTGGAGANVPQGRAARLAPPGAANVPGTRGTGRGVGRLSRPGLQPPPQAPTQTSLIDLL